MKKLRVMTVAAFVAVALQLSCNAASLLFRIPTVLTIDEYAHENGRTVEEVLNNVEASAKEQLGEEKPIQTAPVTVPETTPTVNDSFISVTNPTTDSSLYGTQVSFKFVNGIPMIFAK